MRQWLMILIIFENGITNNKSIFKNMRNGDLKTIYMRDYHKTIQLKRGISTSDLNLWNYVNDVSGKEK